MRDISSIIEKFNNLNIEQQQLVSNIIEEITVSNQNHTNVTNTPRTANHGFISNNNISLSIGDKVKLRTSGKTGKRGNTARVHKFNKLYVAIKLENNGSITQRAARKLEYITEE